MIPMPPSWARAIARAASVTVSIGGAVSGIFSSILRVRRVWVSASAGTNRFGRDQQDIVKGDRVVDDFGLFHVKLLRRSRHRVKRCIVAEAMGTAPRL